jgi:hypothetical protein
MNVARLPQNPTNRYARALETAPGLLSSLNDAKQSELSLTDEVGLARTLLEQVLHQVGEIHRQTGNLNPLVIQGVQNMLTQVQSMVGSAAAIEAKRADQKISATHILTLLIALRDDLKRRLNMAFGEAAGNVVEECFNAARWTGGLKDEDVAAALLEPSAFELKLRVVDREGDQIRESAKAKGLSTSEMQALAGAELAVEKADPLHVVQHVSEGPDDANGAEIVEALRVERDEERADGEST